MGTKSERLAVLPDAEQYALYGLPDFDDGQRSEYLSLSPQEVLLASSRSSLHARVCCAFADRLLQGQTCLLSFHLG